MSGVLRPYPIITAISVFTEIVSHGFGVPRPRRIPTGSLRARRNVVVVRTTIYAVEVISSHRTAGGLRAQANSVGVTPTIGTAHTTSALHRCHIHCGPCHPSSSARSETWWHQAGGTGGVVDRCRGSPAPYRSYGRAQVYAHSGEN